MNKKANKFAQDLWNGYRFTAVVLLNTLAALLLLNSVFYVGFVVRDHLSPNPISKKYGNSTIDDLYPGMSEHEIDALLDETWSRPYIYEPFTQFRERPHRGLSVNVDDDGFRITKNQGPWPPDAEHLNVFVFGGSTAFGYGVPDNQTVASYLFEHLTTRLGREVRVYNFGRGHYYSTQERILFENILTSGVVPDMAIFIDGLNDFYYSSNEPLYTSRFRGFMANQTNIMGFISTTSLGRAAIGIGNRLSTWAPEVEQSEQPDAKSDRRIVDSVIDRHLMNKTLIEAASSSFGVEPIFVWQPVPAYRYDQQYHPFSTGGYPQHRYLVDGYERMAEFIERNPLGDNFLWSADIQENEQRPLYIDKVHYSADFSNQFASAIADWLIERNLVEAHIGRSE